MEEGYLRPRGSETLEPVHLKFDTFGYVRRPTPHAKYGARRAQGRTCTFVCFILTFFGSSNASTWEAWIFDQCTQNVSVVRLFLWDRFAQGVTSSPIYSKTFFNGPNKAIIQWLKWSCEAWGLTRWRQVGANPYPFRAQLIWRYLGIKITLYRFNQGVSYYSRGHKSEQRAEPPGPLTLSTAIIMPRP